MEKKFRLLLLLALLMTAVTGAWAEEQVVYTLDGTQTANNTAYATAGVVNQGGITWKVTGNTMQNPWRIGGKNLSGVDRSVWSESSLDETVTKVTLEFGTASSITVNSITMMVAGDADFNNVIDTKAVTFSANNTVDVTPTEGKEWKNAYYLFVFNVTVEGSTNKFLQLKSIKFYNDPDAQQQGGGTEPVAGTYTVTMKDGVKDADKWTVKVGEGEAQALPIGGLKGETVTVTYTGSKKVIGVKAEKKAAAPAYTLLSAATTSDYGKVVCAAGHLHDAKTAVPDGCTAVGILGKVTETGHGLIIALQDAAQQNWNTINGWTSASYAGTTLKVLPDDAARGTNLTSYATLGSTAVSNWAVAQKSDYEAIFTNLGSTAGDSDGMTYDGHVNAFITTGVGGAAISGNYWSTTLAGSGYVWLFYGDYWSYGQPSSTLGVRPVLGF